jgi:hypothetical protein
MVTHELAEFSSTDVDGLARRRETVRDSGRFETV